MSQLERPKQQHHLTDGLSRHDSNACEIASKHLGLHTAESPGFEKKEKLTIRLMTFNINGEDLPDDISPLTHSPTGTFTDRGQGNHGLPDMYIFCFQEAMKLSVRRVLKDLVSAHDREEHCGHLRQHLESRLPPGYTKVHSEEMVGLFMIVFALESVQTQLQYAQSAVVARGFIGLGNKGACAIRMRISDTTIVCVNAHLAAQEDEVERRNADCEAIAEWLEFPAPPEDRGGSRSVKQVTRNGLFLGNVKDLVAPTDPADLPRPGAPTLINDSSKSPKPVFNIFDSDYLFFCGDLNYRIALEHNDVLSAIRDGNFSYLLQNDQLLQEESEGHMFKDFLEGPIDWRPSYKFDKIPAADRPYDSSKKQRTPSYTDRILYKQRDRSCNIQLEHYQSHEEIRVSDHLPVSAMVTIIYN